MILQYLSWLRPGFIGEAIGGFLGYKGVKETNAANAKQAREQMAFQERMSNTAHQREMADLRAAGLNPILTATGGAGASTPSGAMAKMESALGAGVEGAESGSRIAINKESVANLKETNTLLRVQQDQAKADAALKSADYNVRLKDADLRTQQVLTEQEKTKAAMHEASILANSAKGAELEGEIDETKYGAIMRYIDRAVRSVTGGSSAIRSIKP